MAGPWIAGSIREMKASNERVRIGVEHASARVALDGIETGAGFMGGVLGA